MHEGGGFQPFRVVGLGLQNMYNMYLHALKDIGCMYMDMYVTLYACMNAQIQIMYAYVHGYIVVPMCTRSCIGTTVQYCVWKFPGERS